MLLLLLAAALLYSAGSAHHDPPSSTGHHATVAGTTCASHGHAGTPAPVHEHRHGNDWAPNLTTRARPAGHAVLIATATIQPSPPCPGVSAITSTVVPQSADLSMLGVLRV
jgi:hypothetical protein